MSKKCSRCGIQKDLNEFSNYARSKDKHKSSCKSCLANEYRIYSQKNKEKISVYRKNWELLNPEKVKATQARYRANNLEAVKKRVANWEKNNPEKRRLLQHKRRAILRSSKQFKVTANEIKKLRSKACIYCGATGKITIDHVIPLIRGGSNSIGNLAPACLSCNSRKKHRTIMEWRKEQINGR